MASVAELLDGYDEFFGEYCRHCTIAEVTEDTRLCADCADAVCEYLLASQQAD
jgi:hypothetical protein